MPAAAVGAGMAAFDPELEIAGVFCNRLGSRGHLDLLRRAVRKPPLVGGLPREQELAFPERHLGLRTADQEVGEACFEGWGERAERWLDLDRLVRIARDAPPLDVKVPEPVSAAPRCTIGIAQDQAFHFYYEDNLARLRALGAKLVPFSPLADATLPEVDGLYLGGGYPELFAGELEGNAGMRRAIRRFAEQDKPIYAECGGLMYLCRALTTSDGRSREMAGVFDAEVRVMEKLAALGYVEAELQDSTILGFPGLRFRGHQFRYSELLGGEQLEQVYTIRKRRGGEAAAEGYRYKRVVASYVHAHFASNPLVAEQLVESCAKGAR